MTRRIHALVLAAGVVVATASSAAQTNPGDITFTVPVNITQLFPDVTKVRVTCAVRSEAITVGRIVVKNVQQPGAVAKSVDLPVSGGQVVTTATVVVSVAGVLENPVGKVATYSCSVDGYSNSQQAWKVFNHCQSSATGNQCTELEFRLSDLDRTGNSGTFTW
jgi:hypothetical protein